VDLDLAGRTVDGDLGNDASWALAHIANALVQLLQQSFLVADH
jgi:hypothetical protein